MGLFDGFCMVVGKYKGRLLMLKETLSTLCCAPPGTGKTVGVVIPTIFNSHGLSIVVNDPKPELCYSTTGARAKDGPVLSSTGARKTTRPREFTTRAGIRCRRTLCPLPARIATCMSTQCAIFWSKTPKAAPTRTGQNRPCRTDRLHSLYCFQMRARPRQRLLHRPHLRRQA